MYSIKEIRDTIICGNTLDILKQMPNECIDTVCCSPPYWRLRDYGVEGQLGLEPTFNEYTEHLQEIFDEVWRVLKKTGTCWINLGDSFNGEKSLCNIPHRFAISMTDNNWKLRDDLTTEERSYVINELLSLGYL